MKMLLRVLLLAGGLILRPASGAAHPPRAIPYSGSVKKPVAEVYRTLEKYLSDPMLSRFRIDNANASLGTLHATLSKIDTATWNRWTFCKADLMQMLDHLEDGRAVLQVKVEATGGNAATVRVQAGFEGTYALGSRRDKLRCSSRGVLEEQILRAAGAAQPQAGE